WLKPHPSFFSRHDRDLWGESTIMNFRGVAGAHEVFVNGKSIGTGGSFPPSFEDGREGNHRHKIPSGTLVKDRWNEIVVRIYNPKGKGGFLTEAPFVMNYFWECVFEGDWEFHVGRKPSFGGVLKTKPKLAAYDQFHESNRVLGEAAKFVHGEKLSPADSFAKMKAADDLEVDLMLAEPLVAQPTHFSFDSRGRLWVAQYRQYPYPAGLKMVSRDRYYRSHYDRVPPAPPNHTPGRDIVSIHEDTDGDGKYDKHKVFQDGLNMANAAIRGRGGVWVMHTPYLLFYPDKNFDDVPDGPPVVHLKGFGMEDTHSVANGLVWGMDGWLYGAQGSTTSCHITRPGVDPPNAAGVYFQGCMVWRYHPETRRFELFSEGGGNNFGLELDAGGRLYTGNNGGKTRGFHYMQGSMHLMQGTTPNKFGPPRNPFAFGNFPKMPTVQEVPRFTHFATLVESTALPAKYQNSFLSVDPLHNFVIASKRIELGATFKTSDIGKVLTSDDFAFRPVYIGNAPDGSVLVADFYEHYIAHGQHYQSQIDPTSGRIFRLRGKKEKLATDLNLHAKSSDELIGLLKHPNRWHRHTAVRLLGERKDWSSAAKLRRVIASGDDFESLGALWALYQAFGLDDRSALNALRHKYAPVRYWAVRLICDDVGFANKRTTLGLIDSLGELKDGPKRAKAKLLEAILEQARYEKNAEVRSQMAGSARRLPSDQALQLVSALLKRSEDVDDLYVPLLCWWVLEAYFDRDRAGVMKLFEDAEFRRERMVTKHILQRVMRALAAKGRNQDLQGAARLLAVADSKEQVDEMLKGFELAFAGRSMAALPKELAKALIDSGRSSLEMRLRLGEGDSVAEALKVLENTKAKEPERISVARTLGEIKAADAMPILLKVSMASGTPALQRVSLAALTAFDDESVGSSILSQFARYEGDVRSAAFDVLLSRENWTERLADLIASGRISDLPPNVADRLRRHENEAIRRQVAAKLGTVVRTSAGEANQLIKKVRNVLGEGTGNPYAGETAFNLRCAACHKLFHKGGNIGPDLTPYQRGNLDTLLISVINPNAEIREGFEYVTLNTRDGRSLSGFLTDQDSQVVALRGMTGEDIRVERKAVKKLEPMGRSLMPEGLLHGLSDQELRDFFAYLRISQPISK
ncbi:MAG: PVC-type heme-binding CxxCH protein, partial [Limisphaerales bacterium]